jgi:mRNA interferase HigB
VFDIKGNHYRLVAQVLFSLKTVDIRRIMTHADYSKLSKKQLQDL